MPKINVYLPDDLAAAVRAAGFPVSPVCQQALAEAVRTVGAARRAIEAIRDPAVDPARFPQIGLRIGRRMTPRLHKAVELAREAARSPERIDTRDLLLGMLEEGDNLAVRLLQAMVVDIDELRGAADQIDIDEPVAARATAEASAAEANESGADEPDADAFIWTGLSLPGRNALASALEASIDLGHNYLGCEHLLLGLLDDESSGAGRVLRSFGVEPAGARRAVTTALAGYVHAQHTSTMVGTSKLDQIIRRLDAVERRLASVGA